MKDRLMWWVNELRKKGNYGYALGSYVNRDSWMKKLVDIFSDNYIENNTDLNYSTCFDMSVYISPVHSEVTSDEFQSYLSEHNVIYSIRIEISIIAPYAVLRFEKRYKDPLPSNTLEDSFYPYFEEHAKFDERIRGFLSEEQLTILDNELISIEVPDIQLELRKSHVQIYHCLFQDEFYNGIQ